MGNVMEDSKRLSVWAEQERYFSGAMFVTSRSVFSIFEGSETSRPLSPFLCLGR